MKVKCITDRCKRDAQKFFVDPSPRAEKTDIRCWALCYSHAVVFKWSYWNSIKEEEYVAMSILDQ